MNKKARSHSADPAQEKLRENKSIWNQAASNLITKMIAFKQGLNGWENPYFGIPESNIKDPLPSQVGQMLHDLANEYSALVNGAERIIQEQEQYSQTRLQPMNRTASWWGGRWWKSNITHRGTGEKKYIKNMIRTCLSLKDKLIEVESLVTSSDPNSIPKIVRVASSFGIGPWQNIMQDLDNYAKLHNKVRKDPNETEDVENKPSPPDPRLQELKLKLMSIFEDTPSMKSVSKYLLESDQTSQVQKLSINDLTKKVKRSTLISSIIKKIEHRQPLSEVEERSCEEITKAYEELLKIVSEVMKNEQDNFLEWATQINKQAAISPVRFLNRKVLELRPDFTRKDVDLDRRKENTINHILEAVQTIEKLMDTILTKPDVNTLFNAVHGLSQNLSDILEDIITLAEYHNSMFLDEYREKNPYRSVAKNVSLKMIYEREINKLKKANFGISQMRSHILQDLSSGYHRAHD